MTFETNAFESAVRSNQPVETQAAFNAGSTYVNLLRPTLYASPILSSGTGLSAAFPSSESSSSISLGVEYRSSNRSSALKIGGGAALAFSARERGKARERSTCVLPNYAAATEAARPTATTNPASRKRESADARVRRALCAHRPRLLLRRARTPPPPGSERGRSLNSWAKLTTTS